MGKDPSSRSLLVNILLAVASPLLFLALCEAILLGIGVEPRSLDQDPLVGFSSYAPLFVEDGSSLEVPRLVTAQNKRGFFNVQRLRRDKPDGTYRIFTLGGSTTYGRPYDDRTSFSAWLRALLPAADPTREWEVINAGGISYASYRVARLVEELVQYSPDLFVIYTGHNEFLEERTYGQLRDLPSPVKGALSLLARTRVWAVLSDLLESDDSTQATSKSDPFLLPDQVEAKLDHSAGLDLYERDDLLQEQVVDHLRISLERMIRLARSAGAEVILVTPASNLKDFSPFKSQPTDSLSLESLEQAAELLSNARGHLANADQGLALESADSGLAVDPRNADLLYLRGQALIQLGRAREAQEAFQRARDEDVCPLRALTAIQTIVTNVTDAMNVPLLDYTEMLAQATEEVAGHRIAGEEFFLDHVHPTIEGHKILALALVDKMISRGTVKPTAGWDEASVAAVEASMRAQYDQGLQARGLANLSLTLNWAGKNELSRRLAFQALEMGSDDSTLLMMVARHYALEQETTQATTFFRRAVRSSPTSPVVHSQFGLHLFGMGELEAAAAHFFLATALWPDNPTYHEQFGLALSRLGQPELAFQSLSEASRLNPADGSIATRIESLRRQLAADSTPVAPRKMGISLHPTQVPSTLFQAIQTADAVTTPDGVWTEWSAAGDLKLFALYRGGKIAGTAREWTEQGEPQS